MPSSRNHLSEPIALVAKKSSPEVPAKPGTMKEGSSPPEFLVCVGSSAGGLEALSAFLQALPRSSRRSVVVAQHLSPHARSMLTDILSRQTRASVVTVVDGISLEPDHVYVIPPNQDARIEGNRILLSLAGSETRPKPSVDLLFETLAASFGQRSVGIVLSGTGTDGARGSEAIHAAGGLVLAQTNETARYDGMPRATSDTGHAAAILAPEVLGANLDSLIDDWQNRCSECTSGELTLLNNKTTRDENQHNLFSEGEASVQDGDSDFGLDDEIVDSDSFRQAIAYLKSQAGTDFSQYKESTLRRRLMRRVHAVGAESVQKYVGSLESDPIEARRLAQDLLVSVTSFFRDPEAFASLQPLLRARAEKVPPGEELRVWVAGCATGEEAYSFALVILELSRTLSRPLRARIFASDVDVSAIAHARLGRYSHADIEAVPVELVERYFNFNNGKYEVLKEVRDMCVFAQQDLVQHPPFVKLDVVSCRNVLIYFNVTLQARVIETFHYALKDNGILFLGRSENVNQELFEPADRKARVYLRRDTGARHLPVRHSNRIGPPARRGLSSNLPTSPGKASQRELAATTLLSKCGTAALVVDEDLSILSVVGDLAPYTRIPSGDGDFRAMNLVPRDIGIELQVLVGKSARDRTAVSSRPHAVPFPSTEALPRNEHVPAFRLIVEPFPSEGPRPLYLVGFVPTRPLVRSFDDGAEVDSSSVERIKSLEHELADTREHLQAVVEELEVSNEELQALNEELSSMNEELQSTNEELETTNEELQSTNEELTTLNDELAIRSADLRYINASLENVHSSIDTGLIVLDTEFRVVRFNAASSGVFDLGKIDIGRSILEASCRFEIPTLEATLRQTISKGELREITCSNLRRTFQMRALPFRDITGRLLGAILTISDHTELVLLKQALEESEQRLKAVLNGAQQALVYVKDAFGRYTHVNNAFLQFTGLREDTILGKTDRELFDSETASRLRDRDLEVLLDGTSTLNVDLLLSHKAEKRSFLASRFPLGGRDAVSQSIGNVSVDASAQFELLRTLEENKTRSVTLSESLPTTKVTSP